MRRVLKWTLRTLLLMALVLGGLAIWKREDITRLLAVNSLFAEDKIVYNFSHMDTLFFNTKLEVPDLPASPLPLTHAPMPDISTWVEARAITGLVVLSDGALVHESYYLGTKDTDLRVSWSVAKSFLSALLGIVLEDGDIGSIDEPVTQHVPALIGSAYEGVTIRNVLNMASGVHFDENYFDFNSDINKMGRVLAMGGSMDGFAASISERDRPAGTAWQYVSIDTHVLSMVIRGATGRSISELMVEKLFTPLGLEADPIYVTDGYGVAFVLGGLNLRTRDYSRFGQLFLQNGLWRGQQVIPANWVADSTVSSSPNLPSGVEYGFQWWMPVDGTEGEYFARGVYGQYIYINPSRGVVIAMNAADLGFKNPGVHHENLEMFRRIATQVGQAQP